MLLKRNCIVRIFHKVRPALKKPGSQRLAPRLKAVLEQVRGCLQGQGNLAEGAPSFPFMAFPLLMQIMRRIGCVGLLYG